jgi:hypothetical protein
MGEMAQQWVTTLGGLPCTHVLKTCRAGQAARGTPRGNRRDLVMVHCQGQSCGIQG